MATEKKPWEVGDREYSTEDFPKSKYVLIGRDVANHILHCWPNKRNMRQHEDGECLNRLKTAVSTDRPDACLWDHERQQVLEQIADPKKPIEHYAHDEQYRKLALFMAKACRLTERDIYGESATPDPQPDGGA